MEKQWNNVELYQYYSYKFESNNNAFTFRNKGLNYISERAI